MAYLSLRLLDLKVITQILIWLVAYLLAFAINFTLSFQDLRLTFLIALIAYFSVGFFFQKRKNVIIAFGATLIVHFALIFILIQYTWFAPLLIVYSVLAMLTGALAKSQWTIRNRLVSVLIIALFFGGSISFGKSWLQNMIFNQNVIVEGGAGEKLTLRLKNVDGQELILPNLNHELTIIETWHSHCLYCKKQFPYMTELKIKYGNRLHVVGLNNGVDDYSAFQGYVKSHNDLPSMIYLHDSEHQITDYLKTDTAPHTILLDNNGNVIFSLSGFGKTLEANFVERISEVIDQHLTHNEGH